VGQDPDLYPDSLQSPDKNSPDPQHQQYYKCRLYIYIALRRESQPEDRAIYGRGSVDMERNFYLGKLQPLLSPTFKK
jgi:hypothetical protein